MTTERISRCDDENLYQPKIHSKRIRELHNLSESTGQPITVIADTALKRYNETMDNKENPIEKLANSVSYFNLQKTGDGWVLSFVTNDKGEFLEFNSENLKDILSEATKVVFSSEDHSEESESSAPPIPRNP